MSESPLHRYAGPVALGAGVLGYHSGLPPYGTPIGLTVAALGGWLIRRDHMARHAALAAQA